MYYRLGLMSAFRSTYVFFSEVSKVNIHGLFIRANICCDQFYPKYLDVKIEIRSVDLDKCHLSRNLKVHGKRILPLFVIPKFNCLDLRLLLLLRWRLANKKSEIGKQLLPTSLGKSTDKWLVCEEA